MSLYVSVSVIGINRHYRGLPILNYKQYYKKFRRPYNMGEYVGKTNVEFLDEHCYMEVVSLLRRRVDIVFV